MMVYNPYASIIWIRCRTKSSGIISAKVAPRWMFKDPNFYWENERDL